MRKLVVIFFIIIFIFATVPAFAKTWKKTEGSIFNVIRNCISSFGKRSDGSSVMQIKNKPSWLSDDEVKERRSGIGIIRGMERYK